MKKRRKLKKKVIVIIIIIAIIILSLSGYFIYKSLNKNTTNTQIWLLPRRRSTKNI